VLVGKKNVLVTSAMPLLKCTGSIQEAVGQNTYRQQGERADVSG